MHQAMWIPAKSTALKVICFRSMRDRAWILIELELGILQFE